MDSINRNSNSFRYFINNINHKNIKMNKTNKDFQKEFNKLNKKHSLKLVSKRSYSFYKIIAIIAICLFLLTMISIVIAQDKIDFNNGEFIIKVEHEVNQETLEAIVKYVEFVLNNEKTS